MALIRLPDDALFLWSPVKLTDSLREQVEAIGQVRYLIAPNALHDRFLGEWKTAYPEARIHAAPGLRKRRGDLDFNDDLGDAPQSEWAEFIDQAPVRGNLITTEVVFFHHPSGTALVTDLIQHFAPSWFTSWRALIAKLDLMTGPEPEVPRKFRTAFVDRRAARTALRRILAWPIQRVVMAHAAPIDVDGHAFMRRAFRWLA